MASSPQAPKASQPESFRGLGLEPTKESVVAVERFPGKADAGCVSRFFFLYFTRILRYGYTHTIEHANLPAVHPGDDPALLHAKFAARWAEELAWIAAGAKLEPPQVRKPRMLRVLLAIVGRGVVAFAFSLALFQAGINASTPFVSKALLESLSTTVTATSEDQALYGVLLVVLPLCGALCAAHVIHLSSRGSQHLFTALTQAIL